MKYPFHVPISSLLLVSLAGCITWVLHSFSFMLPIPFFTYSTHAAAFSFSLQSLIQCIGGCFFFLYGKAAWTIPLVLVGGAATFWFPKSYSLYIRIAGLISSVPCVSTLFACYKIQQSHFVSGGVIGSSIAHVFNFYISAPYRFIIGSCICSLVVVMTLQKEGIRLIRFVDSKIKVSYTVKFIFHSVGVWIDYLFPIGHLVLRKKQTHTLHNLIEKALAEDYYHVVSLCRKEEIVDDSYKTLAQIFYSSKSYTSPEYPATDDASETLIATLASFDIVATCADVQTGPRVTTFLLDLLPGTRIQNILAREDDIAMMLRKSNIIIHTPSFGTQNVGIEMENDTKYLLSLPTLLHAPAFNITDAKLPLLLGVTPAGIPYVVDLAALPHLLIAGTTGSGKSVIMHGIIMSILWHFDPESVKLILIDPKRLEYFAYETIPHLEMPILHNSEEISDAFDACVVTMHKRYELLTSHGVRNLQELHLLNEDFKKQYPFIIIMIDEYADIKLTAGEECERKLLRLCQMSRAAGIHIVVATQRPSVDIISGVLKANIPARIACKVASKTDSKVIIDTSGAEKLLGKGDMLFVNSNGTTQRIHGAYISTEEINYFVRYVSSKEKRADSFVSPVNFEKNQKTL